MKGCRAWIVCPGLALLLLATGCSHTPAPVEDRSIGARSANSSEPVTRDVPTAVTRPARMPGLNQVSEEQTAEDGWHIVRPGETLYGIAFRYGMDYRNLAAWNGIREPFQIYTNQRLRLNAPEQAESSRERVTDSLRQEAAADGQVLTKDAIASEDSAEGNDSLI